MIVQGSSRKATLMNPIPFGCGSVKFTIIRTVSMLSNPLYTLYLEEKYAKIAVLNARKKNFSKFPNYTISIDSQPIAKLKA